MAVTELSKLQFFASVEYLMHYDICCASVTCVWLMRIQEISDS